MTTVSDVLSYIQSIAPEYMAAQWDNVGLLCGHKDQKVRKILVALDPFYSVCEEAVRIKADLIVTHHPLFFRESLTSINDDTPEGRCAMLLIQNGISAINAHTNLDHVCGGVNDVLASILKLHQVEILNPIGTDHSGAPYGLVRFGTVQPQSLEEFLPHVKTVLKCPGIRYVCGSKPVHKVAVGGGACADALYDVVRAGCDTFITADIKYNHFQDASRLGLNLIDAGHFFTENPMMPVLAETLSKAFPHVEVILSTNHYDPTKFFV